jgi:prepilin-type N-terminal cleavage/methylation domain-containing protein
MMRQRGFTLMETLVALVIFSLSCMALLELYSGSARAKAAHDSLIERTSRAQALLFEIDLARTFEAARRGTDADRTVWEVTMTEAAPLLVKVDIKVTDRAGRLTQLQTLRLSAELSLEGAP